MFDCRTLCSSNGISWPHEKSVGNACLAVLRQKDLPATYDLLFCPYDPKTMVFRLMLHGNSISALHI